MVDHVGDHHLVPDVIGPDELFDPRERGVGLLVLAAHQRGCTEKRAEEVGKVGVS
jgi:hypothetical protein